MLSGEIHVTSIANWQPGNGQLRPQRKRPGALRGRTHYLHNSQVEYEKNQYVVLEEEDFEKARIESNDTLDIERFVEREEVDKLYYETPYYMAPDGAKTEETFQLLHEAMHKEDKAGISRLVLTNWEHMIAIEVRDKGF